MKTQNDPGMGTRKQTEDEARQAGRDERRGAEQAGVVKMERPLRKPAEQHRRDGCQERHNQRLTLRGRKYKIIDPLDVVKEKGRTILNEICATSRKCFHQVHPLRYSWLHPKYSVSLWFAGSFEWQRVIFIFFFLT